MSVGYDPELFWELTPRLLGRMMRAAVERQTREQEERAWLAWHIAALPRAKMFPRLEKLMPKRQKKAQPLKEMRAAFYSIFKKD